MLVALEKQLEQATEKIGGEDQASPSADHLCIEEITEPNESEPSSSNMEAKNGKEEEKKEEKEEEQEDKGSKRKLSTKTAAKGKRKKTG
jgi:hypothetical protein